MSSGENETEPIERLGSLKKLRRRGHNADPKVLNEYLLACDRCVKWERKLEKRFNEHDQVTINDYLAFFSNEKEGYGDQNEPWSEIAERDPTGRLLQEAQIVWRLMKCVDDIARAHPDVRNYRYMEHPA